MREWQAMLELERETEKDLNKQNDFARLEAQRLKRLKLRFKKERKNKGIY